MQSLIWCPCCEAEVTTRVISRYKNKNPLFENKHLVQCTACQLIYAHPMPTTSELESYYKAGWLRDETKYLAGETMQLIYRIQAVERVKYLNRHLPRLAQAKVLDLGAGFGHFGEALRQAGVHKYYATDPNPESLAQLRERAVLACRDISEMPDKDFDLITASQVLEHLREPCTFMRTALGHLKRGGCFYLDVPERDDTFKPMLDPHVVVYTIQSIENLMARIGLQLVHITGFGVRRSNIIESSKIRNKVLRRLKAGFERLTGCFQSDASRQEARRRVLYKEFQFDQEGQDRWWIRALFLKP